MRKRSKSYRRRIFFWTKKLKQHSNIGEKSAIKVWSSILVPHKPSQALNSRGFKSDYMLPATNYVARLQRDQYSRRCSRTRMINELILSYNWNIITYTELEPCLICPEYKWPRIRPPALEKIWVSYTRDGLNYSFNWMLLMFASSRQ